MKDTSKHLWNWYWHERSSVLLFPGIRGAGRLAFEIPLMALGVYAWYLYLFSLPATGRNWFLPIFLSPFGIVGILCLVAHEIGINYLRDQLPRGGNLKARLALCIPGRVLVLYKARFGGDHSVEFVRTMRLAAFASFAIGMVVCNWKLIFPGA
jgi:hypothetical protein